MLAAINCWVNNFAILYDTVASKWTPVDRILRWFGVVTLSWDWTGNDLGLKTNISDRLQIWGDSIYFSKRKAKLVT